MAKESDILKIVKEDILEVLGRKNRRTPLKFMKLEVAVTHSSVSKAIKELEKEGLVKFFQKRSPKKVYATDEERASLCKCYYQKAFCSRKYFKQRKRKEGINRTSNQSY